MMRTGCLLAAAVLSAWTFSPARGEAIRYTTAANMPEGVRFEGVDGTFTPGSTVSLGRFVVDSPQPGASRTLDNQPFTIALKAPDFDQPVPPGPDTAPYPTTVESSVLIQGHLSGVVGDGSPGLVATFDPVRLGGLGPYLLGHVQKFTFPVAASDVRLPTSLQLDLPTGGQTRAVEVTAQVVPEPAAWLGWGLLGATGLAVRLWRSPASRNRMATTSLV